MELDGRPIVFQLKLKELLDRDPLAANRKKLARAINVNEATISHYLTGRNKPSFDTLLGIAEYFNVSLDFLVYGERPRTLIQDDSAGVRAQVRRAVVEATDVSGRHLDMVTRISRRLQAQIDETARYLVANRQDRGPAGFITAADALGMESCATRMRAMTRHFQSDIHDDGSPGTYFEVVVDNLMAGKPYEYLLYGDRDHWQPRVNTLRNLISAAGVPGDITQEFLRFRCLPEELAGAVIILDLDVSMLERQEPILWERHQEYVGPDGTWAYSGVERADAQGGLPLERRYQESAIRQFGRDWEQARPI